MPIFMGQTKYSVEHVATVIPNQTFGGKTHMNNKSERIHPNYNMGTFDGRSIKTGQGDDKWKLDR